MKGASPPVTDRRELVADGCAAVPHARAEQLGEVRRLRTVHGVVADDHAQDDREPGDAGRLHLEQPEERQRINERERRAEEIDRPAADAIGKRAVERDRHQPRQRRKRDAPEHRPAREPEPRRSIAQHEDRIDVEQAVLSDAHAHRQQHAPAVVSDRRHERPRLAPAGLLERGERRRLENPQANEQPRRQSAPRSAGTAPASPTTGTARR